MKFTHMLSKTLREDPPEAETNSHKLMLKAGLIHQVSSGVYAYLPLAWRSLRKLESIIRQEMDQAGAQELLMPSLQPEELWRETGRKEAFGDNLFSLEDRRGRPMVLAPTHEEVVTNIVRSNVQSYRDLPLILYQIQTKFRDEPRPRAGLVRVREFAMKDAYSFNSDEESLDRSYQAMAQAYKNIYASCSLPVLMAEADSGAIGGKDSHEFVCPTPTGEDTIITCPSCSYTANSEKAQSRLAPIIKPVAEAEVSPIETPNIKTIPDLCRHLNIVPSQTLKAVFYMADEELIFATIRGDLEINEVKLKNILHCSDLRIANDNEVQAAGLVAGSASPVGITAIRKIGDHSINNGSNFVAGGNQEGIHLANINYPRDFTVDSEDDISLAEPGHICPNCDSTLESTRGVEVGHIFKLGTFFSETLGALYLDQNGDHTPIIMGCYGIGVGRLLAATIELNHDEKGILFPKNIAPYLVHLIGLNLSDDDVAKSAEDLYHQLWESGIETLYDNRTDQTPGVKFNDSDLIGLPLRIVVSPRNLKNGQLEVKTRESNESELIKSTDIVSWISSHVG